MPNMDQSWDSLLSHFGSAIKTDQPLAPYTTLQIGGPARYLYQANDQDQLIDILKFVTQHQLPYLVIGGGSNLLISDKGYDGLVILNQLQGIKSENSTVTVSSATPLQQLVDYNIELGLSGTELLTGIPGTVGGAVYGNAGAYGQTISDHLVSVTAFDGNQIITISKQDCHFSYRHSQFKETHFTILECLFQLSPADHSQLKQLAEQTLTKRLLKYPTGIKCPGSFFKNLLAENISQETLNTIPNVQDFYGKVPAWIFLERVNAKGQQLGDIHISPNHANLIYNQGNGTAQDFWQLTHDLATKVKQQFGVTLEPEVQFINLPPII